MTSRSERDQVLDEVIEHLEDMATWEGFDKYWTPLYHAKKGVYLLMDDPGDNLE